MKIILLLFSYLVFFFCNSLQAQVDPSIEWQKCLGGSSSDEAYSIQQTADGGFIVVGATSSNDGDVSGYHFDRDYWVTKLDSVGNLIWQKCLGGSYLDCANSVQQIHGGYIIAGWSDSFDGDVTGNHGRDYWIVKLDETGNLVWEKCYGGSGVEEAFSIQKTNDAGFIVVGYSFSNDGDVTSNNGTLDYWIVKLDDDGNLVWQKSLGGTDIDWASSILQTSDGNYFVAGKTLSNDIDVSGNHGYFDMWIVKLNSIGNILWQKCLGSYYSEMANSIESTPDGGLVVAGCKTYSFSLDYWIVKLDSNANIIWSKIIGGSKNDCANSIKKTKDGGFIVAGESYSNDGDVTDHHNGSVILSDYWIVKLDSDGNLKWQKSFGGNSSDRAFSVLQTVDDGFIVAGESTSLDGDVTGNHGYTDFWIIKLSPEILTSVSTPIPTLHFLLSPNPVQNLLTINLEIHTKDVTIHIYDLQGRMINLPTSNFKFQTSNSIQLNTENLPAAFYTLQIINNRTGEIEVGKFVKQN